MKYSLKTIKSVLLNVSQSLDWELVSTGTTTYSINRVKNIRKAVSLLKEYGLFPSDTKFIIESTLYTTTNDDVTVQNAEAQQLNSRLTVLKIVINNLLTILDETTPAENSNSINIKLPPVKDFDDLANVSKEFHLALTQVLYIDEINGETKIESVDNGSIWINVLVGAAGLAVVASLVWSAAVVYKKILEGKLLAEQVRSLKIKNDSLEDILKAQKEATSALIQAEAEHIQSEHFQEKIPENLERIKNSIKLFADIIDRGAEIHPAIVAPEQVSNLFPDMKNVVGIESKIKKLQA